VSHNTGQNQTCVSHSSSLEHVCETRCHGYDITNILIEYTENNRLLIFYDTYDTFTKYEMTSAGTQMWYSESETTFFSISASEERSQSHYIDWLFVPLTECSWKEKSMLKWFVYTLLVCFYLTLQLIRTHNPKSLQRL